MYSAGTVEGSAWDITRDL